jgi:O-acetyl-ADP-ribose deacetylase (regulator of RNase III)
MKHITYCKGDLLNVDGGVIVHGCNAQNVMGSGVALAIKRKYPLAFDVYVNAKNNYLGTYTSISVSDRLTIVNAITQEYYGNMHNVRYVSYDALANVMTHISKQKHWTDLHIPKIGAGLGGGNWNIISSIITECIGDHQTVTCWELN